MRMSTKCGTTKDDEEENEESKTILARVTRFCDNRSGGNGGSNGNAMQQLPK